MIGRACARCEVGFARQGGRCEVCGSRGEGLLVLLFFGVPFAILIVYERMNWPIQKAGGWKHGVMACCFILALYVPSCCLELFRHYFLGHDMASVANEAEMDQLW